MARCEDLSIIIPCAGIGRRLKSFGPKALFSLGNGETILSRQLRILDEVFRGAQLIVVMGFQCEKMMRNLPAYVNIANNEGFAHTNVAASINLGLQLVKTAKVLLVYGDLVFGNRTLKQMPLHYSNILVDDKGRMDSKEVGVNTIDKMVSCMSYDLEEKWGQMAFLMKKELQLFIENAQLQKNERSFGFELLNDVVEQGGNMGVIYNEGPLAEIDSWRDIEKANAIIKNE